MYSLCCSYLRLLAQADEELRLSNKWRPFSHVLPEVQAAAIGFEMLFLLYL